MYRLRQEGVSCQKCEGRQERRSPREGEDSCRERARPTEERKLPGQVSGQESCHESK